MPGQAVQHCWDLNKASGADVETNLAQPWLLKLSFGSWESKSYIEVSPVNENLTQLKYLRQMTNPSTR